MKIKVGIVDDHQLFLKSLSFMLESFENFEVVVEASNGKDLQQKLAVLKTHPQIILLDMNMPVMDGVTTATWLHQNFNWIKLVALSMNDSDKSVISMIKAGCCAYLLKDTHPNELEKALNEIAVAGYYNADISNVNYRRLIIAEREQGLLNLSEKEKIFLQHACSDKTYKQIASDMILSEKTIDGYREALFKKLNVQSRVGMVLEAIRKDLVKL